MKLNVVYIDDETDLCEIFSDFFSSEDVSISTFSEPTMAIERIEMDGPDLIFIDYNLGYLTEDEFVLKMKKEIPCVLVSGDADVKTKLSYFKQITKPYEKNEIEEVFGHFLKIKNK